MKLVYRAFIGLAVVGIVGGAVVIDGSENVVGRTVALSSVFSALLTLTGFMFTARTFITFKLNEVVYGRPEYRERIEELQRDGAYRYRLYEPLRNLDATVGRTCLWCFATLFIVLSFSFLPKEWSKLAPSLCDSWQRWHHGNTSVSIAFPWRFVVYQAATVVVFSVVFLIIVEVFAAIVSVNKNIRAIIHEWEQKYLKEKDAASNKPGDTQP